MIVKLRDLTKNLTHTQKFYLLYGTNTGQIDETINNILKPKLSRNIYNYDESEIITNANEFEALLITVPMPVTIPEKPVTTPTKPVCSVIVVGG